MSRPGRKRVKRKVSTSPPPFWNKHIKISRTIQSARERRARHFSGIELGLKKSRVTRDNSCISQSEALIRDLEIPQVVLCTIKSLERVSEGYKM